METELTALEVTTGHITWGAGDAGLNLNRVTHWEFEPHNEDATKDRIVLWLDAPAMVTGTVDQAVVWRTPATPHGPSVATSSRRACCCEAAWGAVCPHESSLPAADAVQCLRLVHGAALPALRTREGGVT